MRNPSIDALRAVAVLLVLGRHAHFPAHPITDVWKRGGWVGVDLFFVLSGFLVSGLLFQEYQRAGTITWSRFVVRRGFKIYPAFWCLLLFTLAFNAATGSAPFEWRRTLSELCFVQNYGWPMWGHTWSLAVEEHFYLLLPVLLASSASDRFRGLPWVVGVAAVCLLALRCLGGPFEVQRSLFATHLRLDSLLFGVLLAYLVYFKPAALARLTAHRKWLAAVGVLLLLPAFVWPLEQTPLIYTVGYTAFYLGSGAILLSVIDGLPEGWLTRRLAQIGVFSYSIYLFHAAVVEWLFPETSWTHTGLYLVTSVLVGIGLAKLIELPALRLREAWAPAR